MNPDATPHALPIWCEWRDGVVKVSTATRGLAAKWEPAVIDIKPRRMISFDYTKGWFQPL